MFRLTLAEIQIILEALKGNAGLGYGPKPIGPLQAKLSILMEVAHEQYGDPQATAEELQTARLYRQGLKE